MPLLTTDQLREFHHQGYLVVSGLVPAAELTAIHTLAQCALDSPEAPWELEAQLGYPGAPENLAAAGGSTVRRLLRAYERHQQWREWATGPALNGCLRELFDCDEIWMSQAHHNCLMTKSPIYSSDTGWHQDIRYWAYAKPELISVWLALGEERPENGGLWVIPGSHKTDFTPQAFNTQKFFDTDFAPNKPWLQRATAVTLAPGDTLFFHCRLLHRATRNHTDQTKLSLVFTYRDANNCPLPGSRSASLPEVALGQN